MSKVIARVWGGLGNQLFIYAAARRLALVNNAELVLDDVSGFVRDKLYRRSYQLDNFHIFSRKATAIERLEPLSIVQRYLKRKWNQRTSFEKRRYLVQEGNDFDGRLLFIKPKGALYLEGYWQSELYFKDIEDVIRNDLRIRPPSDFKNVSVAIHMKKHISVAVHVRFFDPAGTKSNNNILDDYYFRAIELMEKLVPDAHYYLFSDNPNIAFLKIPLPINRLTIVNHNHGDHLAYADLWLMSQCNHFIIANSTFSWWGAWLASSFKKNVISPGVVQGTVTSWGFKGLIPDDWKVL